MSLSQTLTWSDGGGATSFDVWFNGVFIGNQAGTSHSESGLLNGTTYTWRIDSVNACGKTTGDTWVFTTTSAVLTAVPVNSVLPGITGTAQVGFTLSGSNGTWTNTPTGYAYRWLSNGVAIGGATANTFLLTSAQLGEVITFEVTASNAGGDGAPATSTATSAVLSAVPVNSVVPVITGTVQVGYTLSGSNGTWSNSPTGYAYQWLAGGVNIGGATANTFLLTATQLGAVITFTVVASNAGGNGAPATSIGTSAVLPAVPVNTVVPTITGTAQVGETLSGSDGTWTNTPTGYAYEWLANGTPIGGATANTFLLTSAQLGEVITFEVTASNSGGSGSPATSTGTSAVTAAPNALATAWAAQVVTNGGAAPSGGTVTALSTFCDVLDAASITAKMLALNCIAPDSLIAAVTPLIHVKGGVIWTPTAGITAAQLTVNGLDGLNGSSPADHLDTGFNPSTDFSNSLSAGLTVYNTISDTTINSVCSNIVGADLFIIHPCYDVAGTAYFMCWDSGGGLVSAASILSGGLGYTSGNRTSNTVAYLYQASSTVPHAVVAGPGGTNAGARPNQNQPLLCQNSGGTFIASSTKRLSFAAIHLGLTAAESLALYNAVQSLRTALGGGYV